MVFGGWKIRIYSLSWALPCSLMHPTSTLSGEDQKWGLSRYKEFLIQVFLFLSLFSSIPVVSNSLQPHGMQHTRPPCPIPTPGGYSDSCPLSWCCHPTISSSVIPFSSYLQLESFLMSQFFISDGQSIVVSASASVFPMTCSVLISFRMDWLPLLAVQGTLKSLLQHHSSRHQFFSAQLSL